MLSKTISSDHVILILAVILALLIPAALCIGKYPISADQILTMAAGGDVPKIVHDVFFVLRLPRVLLGIIAGAGLSLAGYVYQTLFKNPLASPDIIGIASGANAGAAVGIILLGSGSFILSASSFTGGLIAALFAVMLAQLTNKRSLASIVLSGIVISSVAKAVIMILKLFSDPEGELAPLEFWSMGGLSSMTDEKLLTVLPGVLIGLFVIWLLRYQIEILSLSDDEARSLGVSVTQIRTIIMIAATLVVSSIVCVTGLISFIGLIAPHAARLITKRNNSRTALISMLIGSILIVAADCLARSFGSEIPISILTSLMGAPFLVMIMMKRRSSPFY